MQTASYQIEGTSQVQERFMSKPRVRWALDRLLTIFAPWILVWRYVSQLSAYCLHCDCSLRPQFPVKNESSIRVEFHVTFQIPATTKSIRFPCPNLQDLARASYTCVWNNGIVQGSRKSRRSYLTFPNIFFWDSMAEGEGAMPMAARQISHSADLRP